MFNFNNNKMITVIVKQTTDQIGNRVAEYYYRGVHLGTAHSLQEMDSIQYVIHKSFYASRTYFNGIKYLIQ